MLVLLSWKLGVNHEWLSHFLHYAYACFMTLNRMNLRVDLYKSLIYFISYIYVYTHKHTHSHYYQWVEKHWDLTKNNQVNLGDVQKLCLEKRTKRKLIQSMWLHFYLHFNLNTNTKRRIKRKACPLSPFPSSRVRSRKIRRSEKERSRVSYLRC